MNTTTTEAVLTTVTTTASMVMCPVCECDTPAGSPLPVWLSWIFIIILICLSALFSGLTLGLMGLDTVGLQVVMKRGQPHEQVYAKKIYPVRERGNLLLCTLLLGNVAVNAALSILMADLTSGTVGFLVSTGVIVIMGEITPQALCSRYGLAIGAATIYIVYFFMAVTFILAYPISLVLDLLLGKDLGTIYTKEELKELMIIHAQDGMSDVTKGDTSLLTGVLDFANKTVLQIMTPLSDVFSLSLEADLNVNTLERIMASGHSRIPVYDGEPGNITSMIVVKQLALLNPDDNMPIKAIVQFCGKPVGTFWEDTKLDRALTEFKKVGNSHLAIVKRVNNEGDGDPFYETTGIVTLEDVIEELIQDEIVDETDVFIDNDGGKRVARLNNTLSQLYTKRRAGKTMTEAQINAITGFLSANQPLFAPDVISPSVLRKLVAQSPLVAVPSVYEDNPEDVTPGKQRNLYTRGEDNKYFTLVLQGTFEVRSGAEGFTSTAGPFSVFGVDVLTGAPDFKPEFTTVCTTNAEVWRITRRQYETAVQATELARRQARSQSGSIEMRPSDATIAISDEESGDSDEGKGVNRSTRSRNTRKGENGGNGGGDGGGDVSVDSEGLSLSSDVHSESWMEDEESGSGGGGGGSGSSEGRPKPKL